MEKPGAWKGIQRNGLLPEGSASTGELYGYGKRTERESPGSFLGKLRYKPKERKVFSRNAALWRRLRACAGRRDQKKKRKDSSP